jgi:S-adenosylmethionine-diacylgycerolhomoserine-N-methlytransferase
MTSAFLLEPRPPHAQKMDRLYRHQRHFYDLTRKYYLFGRDGLLSRLDIPDGGRVLEIGCGTGRNLIWAARRNPQALFYGIVISRQMLLSADDNARRAGLGGRIFTARGDGESFDAAGHFGLGGFDRVVCSYTLSMMPDWEQALVHALGQINEGGSVHIVDFGAMERWPEFAAGAMRAWLARFHVTPRAELPEIAVRLAAARGLEAKTRRIAGGYASAIVLTTQKGC